MKDKIAKKIFKMEKDKLMSKSKFDRDWELITALDLAIKVLEERPQCSEWIPVSERLPNRNGVYNVTRKLTEGETIYFISSARYFDGQNTWHDDIGINHGRPYLNDVIAWMSLPESYKESDNE